MRLLLFCLLVVLCLGPARAAEPFFKKNDVIALVGGEDMVVTSEVGYFEMVLTRAFPRDHLRFRNLAWEGDTVYEQRRDLNFPTWEEQLDKIGATVVICQFGAMESLDGVEKLPEFTAAYEKLIERFADSGRRRVLLISPTEFSGSTTLPNAKAALFKNAEWLQSRNDSLHKYVGAIAAVAKKFTASFVDNFDQGNPIQRDGIHLTPTGHQLMENDTTHQLHVPYDALSVSREEEPLIALIDAKNKLWFNYWRVQNWAFLFGDRTNQPSSRDWQDPSKRWFPAEREEFLPLIEAKEKEIDALAEKLSLK